MQRDAAPGGRQSSILPTTTVSRPSPTSPISRTGTLAPRARDRAAGLPEVGAELVGTVREHGRRTRELVLDHGAHRLERRRDLREARLHVGRVAEPLHQAVEEQHDRERRRVRHDHDAFRPRVRVRALQDRVRGVGHGGDGYLRRHGRIEVLRDLFRTRGDRALHVARTCVARGRIVGRLQRLELRERRPLGVDRQATAVGELQPELHHLAAHAEVRDEHARRELRQVLAQDVLARPALRRAAGEDRGQALDDLAALDVGLATFLLAEAQLLECAARTFETRAELFAREVATARGVGDPTELGRLRLEPGLHDRERRVGGAAGDRRLARDDDHDAHRDADRQRDERDPELVHEDPSVRGGTSRP